MPSSAFWKVLILFSTASAFSNAGAAGSLLKIRTCNGLKFKVDVGTAFFSAASVARNNKPKKFFPILLAIVSFIVFAFYLCYIAQYIINGGFAHFVIRYIIRVPNARLETIINYLMTFILPTIISFLCGCVGIGFCKASRRIK